MAKGFASITGGAYSIDKEKCNQCGLCITICPVGAIKQEGSDFFINESDCESCGICEKYCPAGACHES